MLTDSLKRLPFDYYGRYRLAAETVTATAAPGTRVLDVGGGPGALAAFLPRHTVVACDLQVASDPRMEATTLVLADGAGLPFADGAFEAVVCLDTLEHVPPGQRPAVVREALRVAAGWLLVACPCATDGVADADSAVLAYVRERFSQDFPTVGVLTEHLVLGHPDPGEIEALLRESGGHVTRFPSGRLDRWLPMMLLFFSLMALGRDDPVERVQAWYNPRFWRDDLRAPSYRQAFLLRQPGAGGPPGDEVVRGLLPPDAAPATGAAAFETLGRALQEPLAREVESLGAQVRELSATLADRERRLEQQAGRAGRAEAQLAELLAFRERVQGHPAVRMRKVLRRRRL